MAQRTPDTSSSESRDSSWTAWGDRLVALLAVAFVASFVVLWLLQYGNAIGNPNLITRLSHIVEDQTWMPPGVTHPYPIIGLHYFGDMWYHIGFGEAQTPYIIAGRPAQYPPIAIYIFKLWGVFGYPTALALMTALNVALLSAYFWLRLRGVALSHRVIIIVFSIILTGPMIVTLDRGGHQYIAVGLLAWALWAYSKNRPWLAVILMVSAISLKTYLVLFLVYPFVRGHWRLVLKVVVVSAVVNGLLFFTFPGKATISFGGFLTSTIQFGNAAGFDNIFNGASLTAVILHMVKLTQGVPAATELFFDFERFLSVPGLIWLALVAVLAASRLVPYWASATLALFTAAMGIPAAWSYNFASASLAVLLFGLRNADPFPFTPRPWLDRLPLLRLHAEGRATGLRWVFATAIALTLMPHYLTLVGAHGDTVRGVGFFPPAAALIAGVYLLGWWVVHLVRPGKASTYPP